jgi:UV DNA damage endonuclease
VPTPSPSNDDHLSSPPLSDVGTEDEAPAVQKRAARAPSRKQSSRAATRISYKEEDADEMSL